MLNELSEWGTSKVMDTRFYGAIKRPSIPVGTLCAARFPHDPPVSSRVRAFTQVSHYIAVDAAQKITHKVLSGKAVMSMHPR